MKQCGITVAGVFIWAVCFLSIASREASAQHRVTPGVATPPDGCLVHGFAKREDLFSFTRDEIQSLSIAYTGAQANSLVLTSNGQPPAQEIAKSMAGLREELKGNACAAFVISDYSTSTNETTSNVAKFLVFAYTQLGQLSNEMLQIVMRGSLSGRGRNSQWEELVRWNKKRQEILGQISDALNVSMSSLIDESRTNPDGKHDHLLFSLQQRDALLKYLYTHFPSLADEKKVEHSEPFVDQASLIKSFLTGDLRPSDVP